MNFSKSSKFEYLLSLDDIDIQEKIKISNKKTPKIIYLSDSAETDDAQILIKSKFEKCIRNFLT